MLPSVKVVDSTFSHAPAIGYGGERLGELPKYFRWDPTPGPAPVKVFTDIRLPEALDDPTPCKIALLLEPPAINPGMYEWILEHVDVFDAILTHQRDLSDLGQPFYWYPFGGSWIKRWFLPFKRTMISMLVSGKGLTEGHKLRHEAAQISGINAYGPGVGRKVESKAEVLRPAHFAVVIENDTSDAWFTEKLIDALSQGCVPIYRGCTAIAEFFNPEGLILWRNLDELRAIVQSLTIEDYDRRIKAVWANLFRAEAYQCPEDWIVNTYGDLLWQKS